MESGSERDTGREQDEELEYDRHCHMENEQGCDNKATKKVNGPNGTFTIPEQDQ